MPTLIDATEFRSRFDISTEITDQRITPHIGAASRRLRRWVGEAAYLQAVAGVDADAKADLQQAEAYLAYHYALAGMHFNMTTKGVTATAMAAEGKEVRRYLSPAEVAQLSAQMLELAREITEPYSILDGTPDTSWLSMGE